jgi:hypothetical protein
MASNRMMIYIYIFNKEFLFKDNLNFSGFKKNIIIHEKKRKNFSLKIMIEYSSISNRLLIVKIEHLSYIIK